MARERWGRGVASFIDEKGVKRVDNPREPWGVRTEGTAEKTQARSRRPTTCTRVTTHASGHVSRTREGLRSPLSVALPSSSSTRTVLGPFDYGICSSNNGGSGSGSESTITGTGGVIKPTRVVSRSR